jgi:hypothetical protein
VTPLPGNEGDPTGVRCPRCGGEVIYNGNYFCEYWVWRGQPPRALENGECEWVLGSTDSDWLEPGEVVDPVDQRVWDELRQRYQRLREYLQRNPEEDR